MIETVRAVFADIDGTLVTKGEQMMPITRRALEKLHAQGVLIGLSTGRKISPGMFQRAKDWNLSFSFDMIIGMNGGQLWDRDHENIEDYYMLDPSDMKEILAKMAPLGVNAMVYEEDYMVCLYEDELVRESMKRNHMKVVIANGSPERLCVRQNYNVLFRFDPERSDEIYAYAKSFDNERYHAVMTTTGIIEFMDPRVNKGMALLKYCERNHIPVQETMAFGDMDNDAEILKEAGWGVCLANGSDYTKAMADDITRYPCSEDGLGRYLEQYILK